MDTSPPVITGVPGIGTASKAALRRALGALVAIGAAAVLALAAWLEPSPTGFGTHNQLNLPTCGWIVTMDLPCPTCGMTTAFAHAVEGRFVRAFLTQPLGFALAIAAAAALLVGSYVAFTGSRVAILFGRLWGPSSGWWLAGFAVLAWAFKILSHKGLL